MTRTLTRLAAAGACAVLLSACGGLGKPPIEQALFDLGVAEPLAMTGDRRPVALEVRAPSWLTTSAMQYRLSHVDPQRRLAYGQSRWVAPPAEMLTLALDRALLAPGNGGSGCRLRIHLDELLQVFDSNQHSHVRLSARASLLPQRGETPVAGRDVAVQVAALSADAQGGVAATRTAVRQLAGELAAWLDGLDPSGGPGLNDGVRCRPQR
jgi:cholesterol transport system auxiliary component